MSNVSGGEDLRVRSLKDSGEIYILFQILTAMSVQNKRHLSSINENLRAQHNNLKATKDHLLEHIGDLMKREKQLSKLKAELVDELVRAEEQVKIEQRTKAPLCNFLREEISQLDKKYIENNLRLRNLENQYQLCLQDYERVIETVSTLLEGASGIEGELSRLKESDITMKAMIFDCERLKRVLEEEKRYFKELCNSEAKSHVERVRQLESIRKNIKEEEDTSTCSIRLSKLHLGMMKLGGFFQKKVGNYRETFVRQETKQMRTVKLGIKTFANCINTADFKMKQNMRKMFHLWHNNAFPKSVLKDITERALTMSHQSKTRLQILGSMQEKILQNNTQMLNLYEKLKYIVVIANKNYRKDKHYGFNIWRDSCRGTKRIANIIEHAFCRVIPRQLLREYFKKWNKSSNLIRRIDTATILLNEYETTKDMARIFRKWRFQVLNHEEKHVKEYIRRIQDQEKITRRLNYEKRKVKILTTFHLKITKIKLRNYFTKYYCNVKEMRADEAAVKIQKERQKFSEVRRATLREQQEFKDKDKNLLITIFRDFVYKRKIVPVYKLWKNESQLFKKQKRSVLSLVLRKQAKNKIYVMNEFRKCVQYYEKKEMHQVLTDLNKKMEAINQKSTQFRELLKNCIENLGIIASKKLDYVTNYALDYQKKILFNTYVSIKIKKAYKTILLARLMTILTLSCERQTFAAMHIHTKEHRREKDLEKKIENYIVSAKKKQVNQIFQWLKRQAKAHNQGFAMMIHIENVFIFYRLTYAFAAIKRKYTAEKYKVMQKFLEDQGNVLKAREENMINLQNTRAGVQKDVTVFFGKFINYEDRKQKIKQRAKTHQLLKKYLNKFRKTVHTEVIKEKTAQNIGDIVMNKNQFIFFRNLMVIRYEQLMQEVKEELAKINKKRKTFEQKQGKVRGDMERRIEEEIKVYNECKEYYEFYSKRYEDILNYYSRKTVSSDQLYLKKQIFYEWKLEYVAVKRLCRGMSKIFTRQFVKVPYDLVIKQLKGRNNKAKCKYIVADLVDRRQRRQLSDVINLWKVNIRKKLHLQIEERLSHLDEYEEHIKEEIKERAQLISNQVPRYNLKRLIVNTFMAFKQIWLEKQTNVRKIYPFLQKRKQSYVRDAMNRWKWLIYYKRTKRAYLKYKKEKYQHELIKDVFTSLKMYREDFYTLVSKIRAANNNTIFKLCKFSFDKIRNEAANERDELNYERKRALFTILSAKISKLNIIKKKILSKWNAQLIPRLHYLPSIMKRVELNNVKVAFAMINEKKYWNEYYIKNIADQVTTEGYNEINSITNSLMRQGYDPDEIKQYLKKRNDKDMVIMDRVIKHFKRWSTKELAVRAFHSWHQYLLLKKNIKKSLTKVFNIAGGIGKYWNRWRTKDVHFNQILKKQSRGNMLLRYKELSRLLKEYHRDIRDNSVNLEQLTDINKEYKDKNKTGIMMALNSFSSSVKKGLRQGLYLWRDCAKKHRREIMDERYDQIIQAIEMLKGQRGKVRYQMGVLKEQNKQLKQKCMWGVQCGKILQKLLTEKDSLSIDLADKEHNLKLLLEDNLRLKQKVKNAKSHAEKLIRKVEEQESNNK